MYMDDLFDNTERNPGRGEGDFDLDGFLDEHSEMREPFDDSDAKFFGAGKEDED